MHDDEGGGAPEAGGEVGGAADAIGAGLGTLSTALGEGEDTEDARRGIDAASDAAAAVGDGARAAESAEAMAGAFEGGDYGAGLGDLGQTTGGAADAVGSASSGIAGLVDDPEAKRTLEEVAHVAGEVGRIARDVGDALEDAVDFASDLLGLSVDVEFRVGIAEVEAQLTVKRVGFHERLGELYRGDVVAHAREPLAASEILGKDIHVSFERGTEQRSLRGIVSSASVRRTDAEGQDVYEVALEVVPAMHLMGHTVDSRIYQDLSVPDLVEQLVQELCGGRNRKIKKDDLTEDYPTHEYLVQHRESHVDFLSRLCAEEGIFFYFDHDAEDEDHEVLVLADSNSNRPVLRESSGGRVPVSSGDSEAIGREVATGFDRHERIGSTDAVVTGFDWSNPGTRVKGERKERGSWPGPPLEVHDHFAKVRHHEYDDGGGQYRSHTAERQARLTTERLDLARQRWTIETTVVTAAPGRTFSLDGADEDTEYLVVGVSTGGRSGAEGLANFHNALEVIPKSMPFRPEIAARRPMLGPETATVVGPSGEEIHTDQHGRIKVQFHWDRRGQNDDHSSAWMRVVQGWAGPGYGAMFIPRVGMEVLVQFLGGDPDRPIVTGCIYNGSNRPPYALPDDKTKSTIKTRSSPGGEGSNELRFEDKAGSEEIYLHAERDLNEVVEKNHSTSVKGNQSNSVRGNQSETITKNQTQTVKKKQKIKVEDEREKLVMKNESATVKADRFHTVGGNELIRVQSHQNTIVHEGNRTVTTDAGTQTFSSKGAILLSQNEQHKIYLNGLVGMESPTHAFVKGDIGASIQSDVLVLAQVGASSITLTPNGIVITSPNITLVGTSPVAIMPSVKTPTVIYTGTGAAPGTAEGVEVDRPLLPLVEEERSEDEERAYRAARCANAVYGSSTPDGMKIVQVYYYPSGMRAVLYQSIDNPSEHVLAYRGTEMTASDMAANAGQGLGMESQQYADSVDATNRAQDYVDQQGGTLELTGHSKGGGQAALNGARTGLPTTTFNAAGVHDDTLEQYGAENNPQDNIVNYSTAEDPLTGLQETSPVAREAPDALGQQRGVVPRDENQNPLESDNPMDHHSMDGVERGMGHGDTYERRQPREQPSPTDYWPRTGLP